MWFGNKRIRFKKNLDKGHEEAGVYAGRTGASDLGDHIPKQEVADNPG